MDPIGAPPWAPSKKDEIYQFLQSENQLKFPGLEPKDFNIADLEYEKLIGSSNYVVKKYKYQPTDTSIAVKKIPICEKKSHYTIQELRNIRKLASSENYSDYIVYLYGICLHEDEVNICMEVMDFSLSQVYLRVHENIKNFQNNNNCSTEIRTNFPEEILCIIAGRIIDALDFCMKYKIIHRDVKPDNILINKNGDIKLCDFGISKDFDKTSPKTSIGSPHYIPPERHDIAHGGKVAYGERSDVWSFGITILELVRGSVLHSNLRGESNMFGLTVAILTTNMKDVIRESMDTYSDDAKKFVESCLEDVNKRPTYKELMATAFYSTYFDKQRKIEIIKEFLNDFDQPTFGVRLKTPKNGIIVMGHLDALKN